MNGMNGALVGIAARIREERERLKLGVAEFSSGVGVSERSQRNYESGDRIPDARYLAEAHNLGVDTDYILTGERACYRSAEEQIKVECARLYEIVKELETVAASLNMKFSPEKKAQVVSMLYRTASANGRVDPIVVEEAVKLAGG